MGKILQRICMCLLMSFLFFSVNVNKSSANGFGIYSEAYDYNYESLKSYSGELWKGVLKNKRDNVSQAVLADFQLCFIRSGDYRKEDTKIILKSLSFFLSDVEGFMPSDIRNIKLIRDDNDNERFDPDDTVITPNGKLIVVEVKKDSEGGIWLQKASIVFEGSIVIPEVSCTRFILVADLYDLEEGDRFTISLDKHGIEKFWLPSGATDVNFSVNLNFKHYVGDRSPVLSSPDVSSKYDNLEGTKFDFSVVYTDPDNDPPKETILKIDTDGDGKYEDYKMERVFSEAEVWHSEERWDREVLFKTSLKLKYIGAPIKFKFAFSDGQKWAVGEGSKEQSVVVLPWALIPPSSLRVEPAKCLPGQTIRLVTGVLKHVDAQIDWSSIEGKEFSGIKVEKVILGKRMVFPDLKNFEAIDPVIIVISSLGTDFGIQKIDSLGFPFKVKDYRNKKGILFEKELKVPEFEFELVPLTAKAELSKSRAMLGDIIDYSLHILLYQGAELKTDITSFTFKPFRKLSSLPKESTVVKGDIIEKIFTFSTWIYEMPLKNEQGIFTYSFPPFEIDAKYEGKNFHLKIPSKEVEFIPTLSPEAISQPLPIDIREIQPPFRKDKLIFQHLPMAAGLLALLGCAVIVIVFLACRKERVEMKERKRAFAAATDVLVGVLRKPDDAKEILKKIQNFFGFLYPTGKGANPQARTISALSDLIAKDNSIKENEKALWLMVFKNLNSLIYGEEDSIPAEAAVFSQLADILERKTND